MARGTTLMNGRLAQGAPKQSSRSLWRSLTESPGTPYSADGHFPAKTASLQGCRSRREKTPRNRSRSIEENGYGPFGSRSWGIFDRVRRL